MRYLALALIAVTVVAANQDEARPKICVPGTRTKMDCNECFCSEDGTYQGCTLMGCPPKIPEVRVRRDLNNKVCQPGDIIRIAYSTCRCLKDESLNYNWDCSLFPESENRFKRDAMFAVCQPGATKKLVTGATCICASNGFQNAHWQCPLPKLRVGSWVL